jgi:glycosyltransferase involved in cell wall biosynthesis
MTDPFFSIIIPTFNRSQVVIKTIQSVLSSTFEDFEIIVVDDGSIDDTKEKILNLVDKRVSYFFIENSGGPAKPRNIGIAKSKGKWLCFLDSDDLFTATKLERLHHHINSTPSVDVFYHKVTYMHLKYTVGRQFNFYSKKAIYRLLVENPIPLSGTCISKNFVARSNISFDENKDFVAVEDWDYWISAFVSGCRFHFIDEELGQYNDVATDSIARNHHQVFKTRMVAEKYRHNLPTFQSFCVKQYWDYEVLKSRLRLKAKPLLQTGQIFRRFVGLVIKTLAVMRHPFSMVYMLTARE